MKSLCVIPARGGSKRIPLKNIKNFFGKPIIGYPITAALKSKCFDEVMVSTDDEAIADAARQYGASVPFFRSATTSDDLASTYDVLEEVLRSYRSIGVVYDEICCLYPASVLIQPAQLVAARDLLHEDRYDGVFTVQRFEAAPQRALFRDDRDRYAFVDKAYATTRTQDLDPRFKDAGAFYFLRCNALLFERQLILDNMGGILLGQMEAQDIDDLEDWEVAEFKYAYRRRITAV